MTVSDLLQQIRINLDKKRLEIAESLVDGRVSDSMQHPIGYIGRAGDLQKMTSTFKAHDSLLLGTQ